MKGNNMWYNLDDFANDVDQFNSISGQYIITDKQAIENQIKLVEEETKEVREAFDAGDYLELTKETIDLLYVSIGLLSKLEVLGVDVGDAMKAVAKNNLSKFPSNEEIANKTLADFTSKGVKCNISYDEDYDVFVIKDENQKVRKPVDYKKADISKFVPSSFITNNAAD